MVERDPVLRKIGQAIKEMEDLEPPEALRFQVRETIRSRRVSWRRRIWGWMISPRTISITPLKLVPVAGAVLLLAAVSAVLMFRGERTASIREESNPGIPVRFSLAFAGARSVAVIGTFNEWQGQGFRMRWDETRREWQLLVKVPAGRHEYGFLVDDERVVSDPSALFQQDDGFGNRNAVLIVGDKHENSI
jgi:hypothetical protein